MCRMKLERMQIRTTYEALPDAGAAPSALPDAEAAPSALLDAGAAPSALLDAGAAPSDASSSESGTSLAKNACRTNILPNSVERQFL